MSGVRGSNNRNSDIIIGWGSHSNIISNGEFELTSNTNLWIQQNSHNNIISNVRMRRPQPTASQAVVLWNAYKNHLSNINISDFPLGILLRSDSFKCHFPPTGCFWDDDTRDNIISNVNIDGKDSAATGIKLDANEPCWQPPPPAKKVVSNIFSNVTIDGVLYGVWTSTQQGGSTDVTANVFSDFVFHNIFAADFNWGSPMQSGNVVK